jgi:hypothetical protein
MKFLTTLCTLLFATGIFAQASIRCTAYKQIDDISDLWPSEWTTFSSEGRTNPRIVIEDVSDEGTTVYRITMYINGSEEGSDFDVTYDSTETNDIRDSWDTDEVYCYKDYLGDYIYTEGLSLRDLVKDQSLWASRDNSKIYFWFNSENYAILVK